VSDVAITAAAPLLAGTRPPPPKALPLFQQLRVTRTNQFEALPLVVFEQPLHHHKSLFGEILIVSDPDGVRRVLVDNLANYPKGDFENRIFTAMFGEGLLSAEPAKWRVHRKVMAPAFDPRSVTAYAPAMAEATQIFARHWDALGPDAVIDMAKEMKALTLQIICRTMFSSDADELMTLAGTALGLISTALDFGLLDVLPIIGSARVKKKEASIHADFAAMDGAIFRMIAEREKNLSDAPKDLLTRLIAAKDPDNGAGLNAQEIRDEVIAVLAGRTPGADDLPNLTYTRMVLEEVMRLYPPVPGISVRVAQKADEICGTKVKAGTKIFIAPWVLHRHRRLWDDPETFDPERFSPENSAGRARFAYLPFGGGPRICIGAMLAMTEASMILATLAQQFHPRLLAGQDVKLRNRITLSPLGGMKMTLARRQVGDSITLPRS